MISQNYQKLTIYMCQGIKFTRVRLIVVAIFELSLSRTSIVVVAPWPLDQPHSHRLLTHMIRIIIFTHQLSNNTYQRDNVYLPFKATTVEPEIWCIFAFHPFVSIIWASWLKTSRWFVWKALSGPSCLFM